MDKEYEKMLLENMNNFIKEMLLDESQDCFSTMDGLKSICEEFWLEATRQADERNSIK